MSVDSKEASQEAGRNFERFWGYLKHKELNFFPQGKLRWWLLSLITIAWAIEQFERQRLAPVLVYFLEEFQINLQVYGLINLAGAVATGVGAYVLGNIADRYGRRPAIVWPMIIYVFLIAGMAVAPNIQVYVVLFSLGAFLIMGMSAAVNAAIRDVTPRMGRAMSFAFISLAWTIGSFMTTGVAAMTINLWPGWRPQLWIGAVVAAVITLLIYIFYRDLSPKIRGQIVSNQVEAAQASLRAKGFKDIEDAKKAGVLIYRKFRIWMVASVNLVWGTYYTTMTGYLPTFLTQWHGLEPARAAVIATWVWFLGGISVFISGWISDKTQLRKLTLSFGSLIVGLTIIIEASLPRDIAFSTIFIIFTCNALIAGFIYPSWCAILSENAEDINPFSVGRAFGMAGVLNIFTGLFICLGLPQVVMRFGWNIWMYIAACFAISNIFFISFAKGPWFRRPKDLDGGRLLNMTAPH